MYGHIKVHMSMLLRYTFKQLKRICVAHLIKILAFPGMPFCVYVYMGIFGYIYICVYVHHSRSSVSAALLTTARNVCLYLLVFVCTCMFPQVNVCIYVCMYVCVCVYIYIYIYIYSHTDRHTYIHTHNQVYTHSQHTPSQSCVKNEKLFFLVVCHVILSKKAYIYIYIYIYNIYTHTHTCRWKDSLHRVQSAVIYRGYLHKNTRNLWEEVTSS